MFSVMLDTICCIRHALCYNVILLFVWFCGDCGDKLLKDDMLKSVTPTAVFHLKKHLYMLLQ